MKITAIAVGLTMAWVAAGARAADAPAGVDKVYAKNCQSCHAKDATGNPKMVKALKVELAALNLVDADTLKESDDALAKSITEGLNKKMPAYGKKLTAEQVKELVAYVRSLAKPAK